MNASVGKAERTRPDAALPSPPRGGAISFLYAPARPGPGHAADARTALAEELGVSADDIGVLTKC
jgi:hypothetical protein